MPTRRLYALAALACAFRHLAASFSYAVMAIRELILYAFPVPWAARPMVAGWEDTRRVATAPSQTQVGSFAARQLDRLRPRRHGAPLNAGIASAGLAFG